MTTQRIIYLFRDHDLRLSDNPALYAAQEEANALRCPLYLIYCQEKHSKTTALTTWLMQHIIKLQQDIAQLGGELSCADTEQIPELVTQHSVTSLHWNRRYTPMAIANDKALKSSLLNRGIRVRSHKASSLFEPFDPQTHNKQGKPYKVYTPFARNLLSKCGNISEPLPAPRSLSSAKVSIGNAISRRESLQPWQSKILTCWPSGEKHAQQQSAQWITCNYTDYQQQRDVPADTNGTSLLSPWLNIGALSVRQIIHSLMQHHHTYQDNPDLLTFAKEVLWREFAHHILYHYPETTTKPFQSKFNGFDWRTAETCGESLRCWQQGRTGIPIVDAGMRQLWATGWMHNRVRMLTASYLTKNLGIHWLEGADWFMHTLIDADLASNTMGWQWVAGCGVDAAPYFRIFNPITQAEKFDPQAQYLKRWLPELRSLSPKQCFTPWAYTKDYPEPQVDIKSSREAALEAFKKLA